jgi:ascorbate-specific PTS system EIIC-type component UlaA
MYQTTIAYIITHIVVITSMVPGFLLGAKLGKYIDPRGGYKFATCMLLGGSTFGIVTFAICLLVIFFFDILPC